MSRDAKLVAAVIGLACGWFHHPAPQYNVTTRWVMTRAVVEHGTLSIDPYHESTGDLAFVDGHYYSDKAPGLSLLAVPLHAAFHTLGVSTDSSRYLARWLVVSLPVALLAALLVAALTTAGLSSGWAGLIALLTVLGTPLWPYATLFYGHALAAALATAAWYLASDADSSDPGLCGALCGLMVVVEYPTALIVVVFGLSIAARRNLRALATFVAGGLPAAAALAAYNLTVFDQVFATGYDFLLNPAFREAHRDGIAGVGWPTADRLLANAWTILLSPSRGILFASPWLALCLVGCYRGRAERPVRLAAAWAGCMLAFNLAYFLASGGWGTGPRHLVPALPALGYLVGRALTGAERWGPLVVLLGLPAVARMGLAIAVEVHVPDAFLQPTNEFWWPLGRAGLSNASAGRWLGLPPLLGAACLAVPILAAGAWLVRGDRRAALAAVVALLACGGVALHLDRETAPSSDPTRPRQLHSLRTLLADRLTPTDTRRVLAGLLARRPGPAGDHLLGQLQLDARLWAEAAETLGRAAALAPHDGLIQRDLGIACERAGRLAEAKRAYLQAIRLGRRDAVSLLQRLLNRR